MATLLGLVPTGRELRDPAARLLEATSEDGRTYTVVDFDAVHDGHPSLTLNVEMVLSFMEYPMVTGLVELGRHDVGNGLFAYPTGSVWLLADILRAYGDFGQVVGLRAAMELAWLVGQILVEAGDTGPMQGCFSHGNLNPWRIALRADGEVQVLGYGLPQVELIRHRDQDGPPIDARSLYYCPPERLEGVPEDPAADTYSLALVCFEVATGKPLYPTHDVGKLERMVGMSEGSQMLSRDDHGLPPKVARALAKALVYDPDTRLSGQEFVDTVGRLLATQAMDGPSLTDVVETLQGHQKAGAPRGRKLVSAADTSMFTPEQLAELADEEDDSEESEPKQEARWKKVDRSRGEQDEEEDKPKRLTRRGDAAPKPRRKKRRGDAEAPKKRSRRRRKAEEGEEAPEEQAPAVAETEPEAEPEEAPQNRRSRRRKAPAADATDEAAVAEDAAPEAVEAKADEADAEEEAPKRRRRKAPSDDAPGPSRRRRKAPPADDTDPTSETDASAEGKPEDAADDKGDGPKRRRRKGQASEEGASSRRRRRPVDDDEDDEPPKRRRRRAVEDDDDEDEAPRRRRRRPSADDEAEEEDPPRRRRRKAPEG